MFFCVLCVFCGASFSIKAQSTNQNFPTPITANEISGKIPARDIGDARLTSYFYVFNATQGDVFINVLTSNLNGDIDVFTADNLRPLTKITIYADASNNETGRVIYLRQPSKLILRIEGRTPNDDAANFRIKFAGSFAPAEAVAENSESKLPEVKSDNQTDVRVNSVGTIVEIKPKPIPIPKEVVAEIKSEKKTKTRTKVKPKVSETKTDVKETENQATITEEKKEPIVEKEEPAVVVIDELSKKDAETENKIKENLPEETKVNSNEPVTNETIAKKETKVSKKTKPVRPLPSAALENIRLIILFKDGTKIEHSMNKVLRVGVDRGVLTVILKDGKINRYSLLDVEKTTIE